MNEHNRFDETYVVDRHRYHKFVMFVDDDHSKLPTGYLNFINDPISRVILLILVRVIQQSCLYF